MASVIGGDDRQTQKQAGRNSLRPFCFIDTIRLMASWIVHLRIAENLLEQFPDLDPAHFAIGSIAPDSGIPDDKWENFDPPYTLTHFCEGGLFTASADLDFYRRYIKNLDEKSDPDRASFLWGYFCHLVTDNLWNDIRRETYNKFKDRFDGDRNFVWEVKRDWYGLDHLYAREHPDCLYWRVFMHCSYRTDCLDLIPPEALTMRVEYIRNEYRPDEEKLELIRRRSFEFLSRQQMDRFVTDSSSKITWWMHLLRRGDLPCTHTNSVTQA